MNCASKSRGRLRLCRRAARGGNRVWPWHFSLGGARSQPLRPSLPRAAFCPLVPRAALGTRQACLAAALGNVSVFCPHEERVLTFGSARRSTLREFAARNARGASEPLFCPVGAEPAAEKALPTDSAVGEADHGSARLWTV